MSARSPFDLLGFADFGQLLQYYHRKRNGGPPAGASLNDAHGRAAAEAWRAVNTKSSPPVGGAHGARRAGGSIGIYEVLKASDSWGRTAAPATVPPPAIDNP